MFFLKVYGKPSWTLHWLFLHSALQFTLILFSALPGLAHLAGEGPWWLPEPVPLLQTQEGRWCRFQRDLPPCSVLSGVFFYHSMMLPMRQSPFLPQKGILQQIIQPIRLATPSCRTLNPVPGKKNGRQWIIQA